MVRSNSKSYMIFHTENEKNSHDHPEEKNIIDRKTELLTGREKYEVSKLRLARRYKQADKTEIVSF